MPDCITVWHRDTVCHPEHPIQPLRLSLLFPPLLPTPVQRLVSENSKSYKHQQEVHLRHHLTLHINERTSSYQLNTGDKEIFRAIRTTWTT